MVAAVQCPVEDQAGAHACPQCEADQVARTAATAEPALAQRGQVDVVFDEDREAEAVAQDGLQGYIAPAEAGGKRHDTFGRVRDARNTDANPANPLPCRALRVQQVCDHAT